MHLVRTGAFLRAARSARLAPISRTSRASLLPCVGWTSLPPHRLSSSSAFPEQSVSNLSEVDPQKTAELSHLTRQADGTTNFADPFFKAERRGSHVSYQGRGPSKIILGNDYPTDKTTNVTDTILSLVGRNLYDTPDHPIAITRNLIESVFPSPLYKNHIATNPVVSTKDNFDVLGFPDDHPGRSRTDTYYVDSNTVLRTHTSAHQHAAFQRIGQDGAEPGYTICADVYRRDSIDRSHFPVFHQMEGALTWKLTQGPNPHETRLQKLQRRSYAIRKSIEALPKHDLQVFDEAGSHNDKTNPIQPQHDPDEAQLVVEHLKRSLEQLVQKVFTAAQAARPDQKQEQLKVRWIEAYFPFTSPSFELEVFWQGQWLELLGCGVVKQSILNNAGIKNRIGWAWGIGIERLAMLLFHVPDIRLFWSQDERFLKQFQRGKITRFEPFSKYPPSHRDVSFWIRSSPAAASPVGGQTGSSAAAAAGGDAKKASPTETQPAAFHENDIMEIVRDVAGTLAEDVELVDEFVSPKTGKKSLCYRINYRSHERTLTNEEVNGLHEKVLQQIKSLPVDIR